MNCPECNTRFKVTLVPRKNCTRLDMVCPSCGYRDYDFRDIQTMTSPDGDMRPADTLNARTVASRIERELEKNRERMRRRYERLKAK